MANKKIRIRLKAYEHRTLDTAAAKIVESATRTGAQVAGPIPLPTERSLYTIIRATHKYKDSREQFEMYHSIDLSRYLLLTRFLYRIADTALVSSAD